jgi:hypothetical protein
VLFGDAGADKYGENEADVIFGGADSDYVEGGTGNDTVFGDTGLVIYFDAFAVGSDRIIGDASTALAGYYEALDDSNGAVISLTLDLMITQVNAAIDGNDTVIGGEGDDIAFGAGNDTLYGDLDPAKWLADCASVAPPPVPAGQDTLIGDGGKIEWFNRRITRIESFKGVSAAEAGQDTISGNGGPDRLSGFNSRNFFAIDIANTSGGEGDRMFGEEGYDLMLGQQGDDRMFGGSGGDDMMGGHNVSGGYDELNGAGVIQSVIGAAAYNDAMDGGTGNDAMTGDNAIVWRRGGDLNPRFRMLSAATIYTTISDTITANRRLRQRLDLRRHRTGRRDR